MCCSSANYKTSLNWSRKPNHPEGWLGGKRPLTFCQGHEKVCGVENESLQLLAMDVVALNL